MMLVLEKYRMVSDYAKKKREREVSDLISVSGIVRKGLKKHSSGLIRE